MAKARPRIEFDPPVHPGEYLAEELDARGLSQKALAEGMGRPVQLVNEIVRGKKAVTADTALDLEAALGISARFWLSFQVEHDLTVARLRRGTAA